MSFANMPEHTQIIADFRAAIKNINEIIDLLNHPIINEGDIIDMNYSPEAVTNFKVLSEECERNLKGASVTASAWFTAVGAHLQEIINTIDHVEAHVNTADQDVAKNTILIEFNVKAIVELSHNMVHEYPLLVQAHKNFEEAQRRYNDAKAEQDRVRMARNALIWLPIVGIALTIVDITMEQSKVDSARTHASAEMEQFTRDRTLLARHGAELRNFRQQGTTLHVTMTGLQAKVVDLKAQQAKLTADSKYLPPLKVNIDHCIYVLSAALGSASNIDNMMSMSNAVVAIKGVDDALKNESDFTGALATLDERGFAELDKRIQAMQKALKKSRLHV